MKKLAVLFVLSVIIFSSCCAKTVAYDVQNGKMTAHISVVDNYGKSIIDEDFSFDAGCSVYDALMYTAKKQKIAVSKSGASGSEYISSINGLSEFDKGALSGWIYMVNGEIPQKSCGAYKIEENDKIEWAYTLDSGKDLGDKNAY